MEAQPFLEGVWEGGIWDVRRHPLRQEGDRHLEDSEPVPFSTSARPSHTPSWESRRRRGNDDSVRAVLGEV